MSKSPTAIWDFWILQGSVATQLRRGGRPCKSYIESFAENLSVIEFWKSIYICQSYDQEWSVFVFLTHTVVGTVQHHTTSQFLFNQGCYQAGSDYPKENHWWDNYFCTTARRMPFLSQNTKHQSNEENFKKCSCKPAKIIHPSVIILFWSSKWLLLYTTPSMPGSLISVQFNIIRIW